MFITPFWEIGECEYHWNFPLIPRIGEQVFLDLNMFKDANFNYIVESWLYTVIKQPEKVNYLVKGATDNSENIGRTLFAKEYVEKNKIDLEEEDFRRFFNSHPFDTTIDNEELFDQIEGELADFSMNSKITNILWVRNNPLEDMGVVITLDFDTNLVDLISMID
jgi:hypothetical protein